MRRFITISLLCSVAFAATINGECKSNCMRDCTEVGSGDVGGTHCLMMFGMGPDGHGWYWVDTEGCDHTGDPVPVKTCRESCKLTCENMCKPKREDDNALVAGDRSYGYYGYGFYMYGRK